MISKIEPEKNIIGMPTTISQIAAAFVMRVFQLGVAIAHRRELAHLADSDDRILADMGLTRSDVHDAYSEPMWQDPTSMLARRAADRCVNWRRATVEKSGAQTLNLSGTR